MPVKCTREAGIWWARIRSEKREAVAGSVSGRVERVVIRQSSASR